MKFSNQSIYRFILVVSFYMKGFFVFAQQWVMDDVAEDNEGGLFSGIFGAILLLGLIWLLGTIFSGQKKDGPKGRTIYKKETNSQNGFVGHKNSISLEKSLKKESPKEKQKETFVELTNGETKKDNIISKNNEEHIKNQETSINSSQETTNIITIQQRMFEELHFKAPSEWELSHIGWSTDKYGVRYSKDGKMLFYAPNLLFTEYEVRDGTEIICDDAFYSSLGKLSQLKVLKLPNTVKYIGNLAFCGNSALETIELSKNLIYLGDFSFAACCSLTYLELPESIRYLGQGCFRDCLWEKFVIPKSVECIKGNPMTRFIGSIYESNSPYYIKKNNCIYSIDQKTIIASEKEVNSSLLNGVCHIAGGAFIKCRFDKLTIPDTIISIGNAAFYECYTFKEISIPNSVKTIGENAFFGCALKEVSIPNSVNEIGKSAFGSCQYLTKISLSTSIESLNDRTFINCGSLERIEIPNHVEHIGSCVFDGCKNLNEVILPDGLKTIGDYVFNGCGQLEKITIPSSVTYIGKNPFVNCRCKVKSLSQHFIIKNGLLFSSDMKTLISCLYDSEVIDIPKGVELIGDSAFSNCSNIVHLTIPNTVKTIGSFAFCDCRLLKSISIPKSVQKIENSSFLDCKNLEVIRILNKEIDIDPFQFSRDCDSLKAIQIPQGSFPRFHMIFEHQSWTIELLSEAPIKEMKDATD